jgi:hypothetical protein
METIELAVEKTMVPLEVSTAKEMVARYSATRKTLIDKTYNINDTRSVWFSIDGFKNFVNNLPENASGVRVHLAAYDQNGRTPNQTTVIFTATAEHNYQHIDAIGKGGELFAADKTMTPWNSGKECPPVCTIMETIAFAIEKTMIPIELSIAKEMVARYSAGRKTLIDKTYGLNDTRSIWFSIDGFKSFVNNLPENANGVRIHLATYDQNGHYPNQTTVIFTGTTEQGDVIGNASLATDKSIALIPWNGGKSCPPECPFIFF